MTKASPAATTSTSQAATSQSHQRQAQADAAAILAGFVVPPGGRKLPGPPTGQAKELKRISGSSGSPNWIDKTGFWQVKGDPQQVLAWTASHVGRSHLGGGLQTSLPVPGQPETIWQRDYLFPPVPGVEDSRELTVETADAGHGQTAIRVDAQVTWLPARTASEMVPAAATTVTLSVVPDDGTSNRKPPQPVTITSPAVVRRISAMVNALPVFPPGPRECGFGRGDDLVLVFQAARPGRTLATAYINGGGCQVVLLGMGAAKLTVGTPWSARGVTALGVPYSGHAFALTVMKAAGSTWNLAFSAS